MAAKALKSLNALASLGIPAATRRPRFQPGARRLRHGAKDVLGRAP